MDVVSGSRDVDFKPQQTFSSGRDLQLFPASVAVDDLNGDGNPDIAIGNQQSNDVSVLLGNGDGTFQGHQTFSVGSAPRPFPMGVAVTDVNGDGNQDIDNGP